MKSDPVVLHQQSFGPFVFNIRHDPSVSSCVLLRIPIPGKQPSIGEMQVARQAASAQQKARSDKRGKKGCIFTAVVTKHLLDQERERSPWDQGKDKSEG